MTKNQKKSTKRLRGSRGYGANINQADLFVPLPTTGDVVERQLLLQDIHSRLSSLHYTHMALAHTIYGRPGEADAAPVAVPDSLLETLKRKRSNSNNHMTILKRLHVVLENLSDVAVYTRLKDSPHRDLLKAYDLVSVAPCNDAVFAALLRGVAEERNTAAAFDIITLDYYSGRGLKLPFRIKSAHVQTLQRNMISMELPMAPALLNLKHRRSLIAAARDVKMASVGKEQHLPLLLTSGNRKRTTEGLNDTTDDVDDSDDDDVGAMALHTTGDLANVCATVLHFHPTVAHGSMGETAMRTLQHALQRRGMANRPSSSSSIVASVSIVDNVKLDENRRDSESDDRQNDPGDADNDSDEKRTKRDGSDATVGEVEEHGETKRRRLDSESEGDDGFVAL
jgi:hypothetical protein